MGTLSGTQYGPTGPQPDGFRALVQGLTHRGLRVEFVKVSLVFTEEDSPMANVMFSVMGRSQNSNAPLSGNGSAKASPWLSSAAFTRAGRRRSRQRAAELVQRAGTGVPKVARAVSTGSAGRRSNSTCATSVWGASTPLPIWGWCARACSFTESPLSAF